MKAINRRKFIKRSTMAAAAAALLPGHLPGAPCRTHLAVQAFGAIGIRSRTWPSWPPTVTESERLGALLLYHHRVDGGASGNLKLSDLIY